MGSAPSVPTIADPSTVTAEQTAANTQAYTESLLGQAINQATPYGSLTYQQTGTTPYGTPIMSASMNYSQPEQQILGEQQLGQEQLGASGNNMLFNTQSQYSMPPDLLGGANSLTNQMMGSELSSLEPYFQTQGEQLNSQLSAEGLNDPNNPAYKTAQMDLLGTQNQAVNSYLAQAYPQAFSMAATNYELPLQTAMTELGAAQPASLTGSLTSTPNVQAPVTNVIGAYANQQNAEMQAYNAQMAQYSAGLTGMAGLGSAGLEGALLFSDDQYVIMVDGDLIALKPDMVRLGTLPDGTPTYRWTDPLTNERRYGPKISEVVKRYPDLVVTYPGGYRMLDYKGLLDRQKGY
jgi:hypothetical protein